MLSRVLEPEVMDSHEEAVAYDEMDHAEVNRVFVDDLLAATRGNDLAGGILDLGTGPALIPIELASRAEEVRVMAVDLSANMLDLAAMKVELANLTDRVALQQVDAKHLPFDDGYFACVMSNSIVHHIPSPIDALQEAWRVLAPGGLIFFRDLLRPNDDEEVRRLVDAYAGECTAHQRKLFDDSLRAALSLEEISDLIEPLCGERQSVQQTTDRHWTWAAHKPA